MKGICFKKNMFMQIISGKKTQTRRLIKKIPNDCDFKYRSFVGFHFKDMIGSMHQIKNRYKEGETVYLKEPYDYHKNKIVYKFEGKNPFTSWQNKLFMAEKYARYFIKIISIKVEKLHDITNEDAIKEGIEKSRPISIGWMNYINHLNYFDFNKKYFCTENGEEYSGAVMSYFSLWEKINGGNVIDENPFVFVYEFELLIKN